MDLAPPKTGFASDVVIERIIVLGYNTSVSKKALIEPSNHEVDIQPGPLWLHRASGSPLLTIRNANVRVADDWTITIL